MLQRKVFEQQESEPLIYSQVAFLVNLIASPGTAKAKTMSESCGLNIGESLAKLGQDGVWSKMYGGFCQLTLDGSFEEFSGTFPDWGIVSDGVCTELTRLERTMREKGFLSLGTPSASQSYKRIRPLAPSEAAGKHGKVIPGSIGYYRPDLIGQYIHPDFLERLMGFPTGWSEVKRQEMQ